MMNNEMRDFLSMRERVLRWAEKERFFDGNEICGMGCEVWVLSCIVSFLYCFRFTVVVVWCLSEGLSLTSDL